MAQHYGMLPTELLKKASTFDFMIHNNANILRDRWSKQRQGENIADTFSQDEIDKVYADFKKSQEHGHENKR